MDVDFDVLRRAQPRGRRPARAPPTRPTSPARAGPTCAWTSRGREGIADDGDLTAPGAFGNLPVRRGLHRAAERRGHGRHALAGLHRPRPGPPGAPDRRGRPPDEGDRARGRAPLRAAHRRRRAGHQPGRARRRHQRARAADRQHPRGREDPRHRPRRLRRQRGHRGHGLGADPPRRRGDRRDADDRRHRGARRRALRALSVLLAVPNVSEGRDAAVLDAIGAAFAAGGARVLDRHADPDHHRAVFTLAAEPRHAARGARRRRRARRSSASTSRATPALHPHVGALDVAPVVFRTPQQRGAALRRGARARRRASASSACPSSSTACWPAGARAPSCAAAAPPGSRSGWPTACAPDFGPARLHPTAGAVLVAARPPLVAFNLELGPPATGDDARARSRAPSARAARQGCRACARSA